VKSLDALSTSAYDQIRIASPEAVDWYVNGMRSIYLPKDARNERSAVKWKPSQRLLGKFARFAIHSADRDAEPLPDLLLIATSIALGRNLGSVYHRDMDRWAYFNQLEQGQSLQALDYGYIKIVPNEFTPCRAKLILMHASVDYGRADVAGRDETCELFKEALADGRMNVINRHPSPASHNPILDPRWEN
jgi:hypothetical protein